MTERWKAIPKFPGYSVSNLGRVRNRHGRILRQSLVTGGMSLILSKDGYGQGGRVARLVGEMFCKAYRSDLYPVYKDGDPRNCAASNLKWVPRSVVSKAPYTKNKKP